MNLNSDWNASYLRQPAFPTLVPSGYAGSAVSAGDIYGIGAASTAIGGVATAYINLKGQRERAVSDEKMAKLAAKQARESNVATQNMMTISLLQQQESAKSKKETTKLLVLGLGTVAALAVIGGVAVVALKTGAPAAPGRAAPSRD